MGYSYHDHAHAIVHNHCTGVSLYHPWPVQRFQCCGECIHALYIIYYPEPCMREQGVM